MQSKLFALSDFPSQSSSQLILQPVTCTVSHRVVPVIEMQRQESRDERDTKRRQREEAEAAAEDAARVMAAQLAEKRRQREEAEATAKEIARVTAAAEEAARAMVEKQAEKSRQRERAMAAAEEAARAMAAEQAQQRRQHEEAEAAGAEEAAAHLCKPVNNECADETQVLAFHHQQNSTCFAHCFKSLKCSWCLPCAIHILTCSSQSMW